MAKITFSPCTQWRHVRSELITLALRGGEKSVSPLVCLHPCDEFPVPVERRWWVSRFSGRAKFLVSVGSRTLFLRLPSRSTIPSLTGLHRLRTARGICWGGGEGVLVTNRKGLRRNGGTYRHLRAGTERNLWNPQKYPMTAVTRVT